MATLPTISGEFCRYKADSISYSAGSVVDLWPEIGARHPDLAQTTIAKRPTVQTGSNGHKTVRFDGSDDVLTMSDTLLDWFRNRTGATLVVLTEPKASWPTVDDVDQAVSMSKGDSTSTRSTLGFVGPTGFSPGETVGAKRLDTDASVYASATAAPTGVGIVHTVTFNYATATISLHRNGTSVLSQTWQTAGSSSDTRSQVGAVGGYGTGLLEFFEGDITEVIGYSRVLTDTERAQVHSYAQDEYGWSVSDYVATASGPAFDVAAFDPAAFAAAAGGTAAAQDTVALTDSVTTVEAQAFAVADTASLSDSTSLASARAAAPSDTLALTDSASASAAGQALATSPQDTAALSDTVATAAAKASSPQDTVALTDSTLLETSRVATASDAVALVDVASAANAGSELTAVPADTVALSDSMSLAAGRAQAATDTVALSDLLRLGHSRTAADTVSTTDGVTTAASRAQAAADTVALTDAATAVVLRIDIADTVGLADTVTAGASAARTADAADDVALSDAASSVSTLSLQVSDTLNLADEVTTTATLLALVNDTAGLADATSAAAARAMQVGDMLGLTDDTFIPGVQVKRQAFVLHHNRVLVHIGAGIYR